MKVEAEIGRARDSLRFICIVSFFLLNLLVVQLMQTYQSHYKDRGCERLRSKLDPWHMPRSTLALAQ